MECDVVIGLLFDELSNLKECQFADQLLEKLKIRIDQRSNDTLMSAVHFLHDPKVHFMSAAVKRFLVDLYKRLYVDVDDNNSQSQVAEAERPAKLISLQKCSNLQPEVILVEDKNLQTSQSCTAEKDEMFLDKIRKWLFEVSASTVEENCESCISNDLEVLKRMHQKTDHLSNLFKALNGMPLTTIEAEQAFSCAGCIKTKIRNRISDETLCAILLLRNNKKYLLSKQ